MRIRNLVLNHNVNRADQADLEACLTQNQADDVGRGGLAIRARHANHAQLFARIIIEERRHGLHRCTRIRNLNQRYAGRSLLRHILNERCHSALLCRHC